MIVSFDEQKNYYSLYVDYRRLFVLEDRHLLENYIVEADICFSSMERYQNLKTI